MKTYFRLLTDYQTHSMSTEEEKQALFDQAVTTHQAIAATVTIARHYAEILEIAAKNNGSLASLKRNCPGHLMSVMYFLNAKPEAESIILEQANANREFQEKLSRGFP